MEGVRCRVTLPGVARFESFEQDDFRAQFGWFPVQQSRSHQMDGGTGW
jgi:hypothetical protein